MVWSSVRVSGVAALPWMLSGHVAYLGNHLGAFWYFLNFYSWCFIYKLSFLWGIITFPNISHWKLGGKLPCDFLHFCWSSCNLGNKQYEMYLHEEKWLCGLKTNHSFLQSICIECLLCIPFKVVKMLNQNCTNACWKSIYNLRWERNDPPFSISKFSCLWDHKWHGEKSIRARGGGFHKFILGDADRFLWEGDIRGGDASWENIVRKNS